MKLRNATSILIGRTRVSCAKSATTFLTLLVAFGGAGASAEGDSQQWFSELISGLCDAQRQYGSRSSTETEGLCTRAALTEVYVKAMRDAPNTRGMAVWQAVFLPMSEDPRRKLELNDNGRIGVTDRKVRRDLRRLGIDADGWQVLQTVAINTAGVEFSNRRRIHHERICDRRSSFETKEALARAMYDSASLADVELGSIVENALSALPADVVDTVVSYALDRRPVSRRPDPDAFVAFQANGIQDMTKFIERVICW